MNLSKGAKGMYFISSSASMHVVYGVNMAWKVSGIGSIIISLLPHLQRERYAIRIKRKPLFA